MNANSSQTASNWLQAATAALTSAGIGTARLDCLVLLEDETGKDRAWLLAHPEHILQRSEIENLGTKVVQRAKHVPLAYLRGRSEFYGREFIVNEHVLEPRPESETMIELLKTIWEDGPPNDEMTIADVGTGSGALAITAKLELPRADVIAIDIDPWCLRVVRQNMDKHRVAISVVEGNLLEPLFGMQPAADILLCNLPYVPDSFIINPAAMNEPKLAIFGGPDGLDLYRTLFNQLRRLSPKPRYILAESMPPQHAELTAIAKAAGYLLSSTNDFIQVFTKP